MGSEWAAMILGVDTKKLLHFRRLKRLLKLVLIIDATSFVKIKVNRHVARELSYLPYIPGFKHHKNNISLSV